jgi:hypothetical protein
MDLACPAQWYPSQATISAMLSRERTRCVPRAYAYEGIGRYAFLPLRIDAIRRSIAREVSFAHCHERGRSVKSMQRDASYTLHTSSQHKDGLPQNRHAMASAEMFELRNMRPGSMTAHHNEFSLRRASFYVLRCSCP